MQAGIPGVLMVPNDNPALGRAAGGILYGPVHLQFVYPALDGYVSITFLFGDTIGPYTRRLMEWVCEEGHCDTSMRDWDWVQFGLRLATVPEAASELECAKEAVTKLTTKVTAMCPDAVVESLVFGGACYGVQTAAELDHLPPTTAKLRS